MIYIKFDDDLMTIYILSLSSFYFIFNRTKRVIQRPKDIENFKLTLKKKSNLNQTLFLNKVSPL